jgi:outer membrane lipoprotein-sorting protein
MKRILFLLCTILVLSSCGKERHLVVMSKGPAEIDIVKKTIKAKDGSGHEQQDVFMTNGDNKVVFKLSTPAGEATVEILDNGLYVVNVKNDTIIGSFQKYGDPRLAQNSITQENLKMQIDSLQLLSEGKNVSAANKNFYILPNQATKITDNINAIIVGPYHRMRSAETVDGKAPDVYRFYSIKEIRETISKLQTLTIAPKQ